MIASVTAMILNIILNYIFIKEFGYIAAGYTTLFCYMLQALIDYLALKKVVKEPVYNMKFIVLLSIAVIVLSFLSIIIYDYWFIRYSIIAIVFILVIIFRNKIISLFKNMKNKKEL
jgi:O-antigen/teichoic acid export membrane protein